jgi:ferredoxin
MRVRVDRTQCGCSGYCARLVPGVFHIGDDSVAWAIGTDVPQHLVEAVREAATVCPTGAVVIEDPGEHAGG